MPHPMTGGDGLHSYVKNSSFQRQGVECANNFVKQGIAKKLDVKEVMSSSKWFNIADLGCSTGPNTFIAIQNIIDSVLANYKSSIDDDDDDEPLEFQVFFNDIVTNDFNMLFKSLPSDRNYFATAVPGPFHGRLFPKASLHFVYSSFALHWLSCVPREVVDKNSHAYNKGRIYYGSSPNNAVSEAFSAKFDKDMQSFLEVRSEEIVVGGLMAFIILCNPDGAKMSSCRSYISSAALEASILDLVKVGLISETEVDSFNLSAYTPTPSQVKGLIEANGCFNIERMEPLFESIDGPMVDFIPRIVNVTRAIWEELIKQHFGSKMIDEIFDRFAIKLEEALTSPDSSEIESMIGLFVLVKLNNA